jgi:hypothetical protein
MKTIIFSFAAGCIDGFSFPTRELLRLFVVSPVSHILHFHHFVHILVGVRNLQTAKQAGCLPNIVIEFIRDRLSLRRNQDDLLKNNTFKASARASLSLSAKVFSVVSFKFQAN